MSLEAGKLRHRVRFERKVAALDSHGDQAQNDDGTLVWTWEPVVTVWAAIEPLSVREFISSAAMQSQIVARLVIRYRTGLDASMQAVHLVNDVPAKYWDCQGFLQDKESGLEFITVPVSEALDREL